MTTWTILTVFLTHPADTYITGQFTSQAYCISALHKSASPEMRPDIRQCVRIEQADMDAYITNKKFWSTRHVAR